MLTKSQQKKIIIYSGVTSFCSNRCLPCGIHKVTQNGIIGEQVKKRTLDFIKSFPDIKFTVFTQLLDDPLMDSGIYNCVKETVKLKNVELWLCTNGALLSGEVIQHLIDAGLCNIWFTLLGTNKEDYIKYAGVDNYLTARKNLSKLVSKHDSFKRIKVTTFSRCTNGIKKLLANKKNISLEAPKKAACCLQGGSEPDRSISISVNGEIAYNSTKINFLESAGNILSLSNAEILEGYLESEIACKNVFSQPGASTFTNSDGEKSHCDLEAIFPDLAFGINTQLIGIAQMELGKFGVIGDDVWLNVAVRDSDRKRLRIGDFACIGRHSVISALTYVELGDFALLGPRVFIADSNHGFSEILLPYVQQPSTGSGPLVIEENCWIGVNASILGGYYHWPGKHYRG